MKESKMLLDKLKDPSVLLILTYAPAGLGHLRVTDALYRGLPQNFNPLVLGARDGSITYIHRIMSIHPLCRDFGEWLQSGRQEQIFSYFYRKNLRKNTEVLYHQLVTLIDQHFAKPKKVIVVATHFALAHQLAEIKSQVAREKKVEIFLILQVTDDSPQRMWYVKGADLIFVPSHWTKRELFAFSRKEKLDQANIEVIPYPISPNFSKVLSKKTFQSRVNQLSPRSKNGTNFALPVSGAAVGLNFFTKIINTLNVFSSRFTFYVISKKANFTKSFIQKMIGKDNIKFLISESDREVVGYYEKVYVEETISLEITKPSEQAFKTLLSTNMVGGSFIFFAQPVGRQEYDNINFMISHELIPSIKDNEKLWKIAEEDVLLRGAGEGFKLKRKFRKYRGFRLPIGSFQSAKFIYWCLSKGLVQEAVKYNSGHVKRKHRENELGVDGVDQFWQKTIEHCLE